LKEVEVRAEHRRETGTAAGMAKPPNFNRTISWTVFWCQFETVAEHNCWMHQEKSTYLITALQVQATDMPHRVSKGAT
jgi:hypothetical protein